MRIRIWLALTAAVLLAACAAKQPWALNDISGHMPDLEFQLFGAGGKTVDAASLRGKIVLLYFGYTHCPDVCPLTMTHLHTVLRDLGKPADDVRIVFVSLDPARDTPKILDAYVHAFDPRAIGLTGTLAEVRALAKRYRIGFSLGKPDANGNYEVTHSSAVFVFDRKGRARLLATSSDNTTAIAHDLKRLLENG